MPRGRTSEYIALVLGTKLGRRVTPIDLGLAVGTDVHEVGAGKDCDPVEVSQRAWREVRKYLTQHGTALASRAVELYEPSWRLLQGPLLAHGSWLPDAPIALEDIELGWEPSPPKPVVVGQEPEVRRLLPLRTRLQTFPDYSSAIRYVSPPGLFENRPCYRLLGVSLSGPAGASLRFGQACYFDKIDVGEALAHELSSAVINATPAWPELPFRSLVSDPFDLALRTVNTSINTLTIRYDRTSGQASFFLLRRDPVKVAMGGGEYGLVPAGEFQPASVSPDSVLPDLSMWRNIVREYSEELLGRPEHDGSSGRPLDYERWPFFWAMEQARERGELRVYVLGVALCAVSLNATVMTAAVIDSVVFDSLFRELAHLNAEGEVVACWGDDKERSGLAFDEATVNHILQVKHMMSTHAKAGLSLAWRHRAALLEGLPARCAAVSNVTNSQKLTNAGAMPSSDVAVVRAGTAPLLLRDVDLLVVPNVHEAMRSSAAPHGEAQADRSATVLASLAFLGRIGAGAPAEGDDQIGDQLANLLCGWVGMMNRRESLQLLGWAIATISASLAASDLDTDEQQRLARAISSPSRVDVQVIDHIAAMHRYCKRQDDVLGSRAALPIALAQRNLVGGLLAECPTVLRPRLLSVYSDMLTSVGYYFFDLNDFDSARHHCDQARAAAHDAGNTELGVYALCEMSYIASSQRKAPAGIDLAAAAQSLASKAEDLPLMRICATQRAATAYAVDGQYKECMVECEKAEDGLAHVGQVPAESWGYFFNNEGYLARMKSECLLHLGKPQEAAASASMGLILYDKSFADGYTQCTLHLGDSHLQCGEIEEAARVIGNAADLVIQTNSARLVRELRTTRAKMQPWQDTHAVKELDDHLATYGLTPNSTP